MEEYGSYNWNQQGNEPQNNTPMEPKKQPGKRNGNGAKWAKKIGAVALSAVLFGGVAGGVFTGVTYATGATAKAQSTQTDSNSQETTKTTLQTTASSGSTGSSASGQSLDVSSIAKNAMPSIVAITNKSVQEVQDYFSMFSRGSGTQEQEVESQGSGIIIGQNDSELLIATNNHVVEDADTLSVCFADDQAYEATVKGTDADNDLAVIAVKLSDISDDTMSQIKIAEIGDSDQLQVGEQVVAIGNALGYGQSVTTGIVSAVNRQLEGSDSENGFIQTDAAINPGNSGGALVNMAGELVGITSMKLSNTSVEGMGFALPINDVITSVEQIIENGKVTRPQIGISGVSLSGYSSYQLRYYRINTDLTDGIYVSRVTSGGAASKAGIQEGDIIVKFDGKEVTTYKSFLTELYSKEPGDKVSVVVNRNGTEKTIEVTLGEQ